MPALYDEIAMAARAKCETHIANVTSDRQGITLELTGSTESDVWLYVFDDDGESCGQRFEKVPPFRGSTTVTLICRAAQRGGRPQTKGNGRRLYRYPFRSRSSALP